MGSHSTLLSCLGAPPIPKCYAFRPSGWNAAELSALAKHIQTSPYLESSPEGASFVGTRGFAVIFRRSGIPQVVQTFPWLTDYLALVLKQGCNAFYLNPLLLRAGSQVEAHIDCSISSYPGVLVCPRLVSVLYLQVPDNLQGGTLVLEQEGEWSLTLRPQEGYLLHFLGYLTHSVSAMQSPGERISLICEQYTLEETLLRRIPEMDIKSRAV
jgi:hypothetical protein